MYLVSGFEHLKVHFAPPMCGSLRFSSLSSIRTFGRWKNERRESQSARRNHCRSQPKQRLEMSAGATPALSVEIKEKECVLNADGSVLVDHNGVSYRAPLGNSCFCVFSFCLPR